MKKNNLFYRSIVILLCALPVFLGFLYVYLFGTMLPYWDDYQVIPLLEKFFSNSLTFSDFFAQHNEHRIFFPSIIFLLLGVITKYNLKVFMYFIELLFLVNLIVIYLKAKNQYAFGVRTTPIWFIPIPFLLFSWRQVDNMLWGFQIAFVMPLTFGILSFYFVDKLLDASLSIKRNFLFFMLAVVSATISSFSSAMGLLVWIIGIYQITILRENIKKRTYLLIWALIGASEWVIYFINYQKPSPHPSLFTFWNNTINFAKYFATTLGGFSTTAYVAPIFGLVLLGSFFLPLVKLYRNHRIAENSFWVSLGLYSLGVVFSISIGRSGFGVEQAMCSRYATYSIPLIICIYMLLTNLLIREKKLIPSIMFALFLCFIIATDGAIYEENFTYGKDFRKAQNKLISVLINYETESDESLKRLFVYVDTVRQDAAFLKAKSYNVFNVRFVHSK